MPELIFRHLDDVPWLEARAQMHGERRVVARVKLLEASPNRTVNYAEYDPGMIIEEHGHSSDHVVFVMDGSVNVGGTECPTGMMILLEHGAVFGPLVAGPDGAKLLEFYTGNVTAVPADPEGFDRLLAERGITRVPAEAERRAAAAD